MARKRQREIALAMLAVVLIATIVWRVRSVGSVSVRAGTGVNTSAPRASQQQGNKRDLAEVNLEALRPERPEPGDSDRNPFRFKPKPPPPPPPVPAGVNRPQGQAHGSGRSATSAADSAEVHRRGQSRRSEGWPSGCLERFTWCLLRPGGRDHRRALSNSEDRRRIN